MDRSKTVGIIANPASARDIRRIVAFGGALTTHDKLNILQRLLAGLAASGVERVLSMSDGSGIAGGLLRLAEQPSKVSWPALELVDQHITHSPVDTTTATRAMVDAKVDLIVVLGGDGTNRIVAAESGDIPLLSISTGTNNAFPRPVEPTVAGIAAGLIATDARCRAAGTYRTKKLLVECGDRIEEALVDVAMSSADGVGSGAVWDASSISELYLSFAEADAIGLSAIGGHTQPVGRTDGVGLAIRLGEPARTTIHPPIGPGLTAPIAVQSISTLQPDVPVAVGMATGVAALDGERLFRFGPESPPVVTLRTDGATVVDVEATMAYAAANGLLGRPRAPRPVRETAEIAHNTTTDETRKTTKGKQRDATQSARPVHRDGTNQAIRVTDPAGVPL